jgi:hypothetical protein
MIYFYYNYFILYFYIKLFLYKIILYFFYMHDINKNVTQNVTLIQKVFVNIIIIINYKNLLIRCHYK